MYFFGLRCGRADVPTAPVARRGRWFLACVVVAAVYADVPAVGASQGGGEYIKGRREWTVFSYSFEEIKKKHSWERNK